VDVLVRAAAVEDAPRVAHVHVEAWRWAYKGLLSDSFLEELSVEARTESWRSVLEDLGERRVWVAERNDVIVGISSTGPTRDGDASPYTAEVYTLYLVRDALGTGVGRALFERAVEDLRDRGFTHGSLWVLEKNDLGRRFYEEAGWSPDGAVGSERIDCENRPTVRYVAELG
jgi:GNAT superfamily N-acetyltransferase